MQVEAHEHMVAEALSEFAVSEIVASQRPDSLDRTPASLVATQELQRPLQG